VTATDAVRRRVLTAVAAAAIAMTLNGCGGAADGVVATNDGGSTAATAPALKTSEPSPSTAADQPAAPSTKDVSPKPTLPPGDPGTDVPGTDDPNGDLGNESATPHPKDAKTSVPRTSVLDAETVASVAGGSWTVAAAPVDSCAAARPAKVVATRSTQLTGTGTGTGTGGTTESRLVETVSTHHGADAAVAAVRALERRLIRCHATSAPDPRIGDASVQLTLTNPRGTITVVTAAAVEGVTFVLSGSGPATGTDKWSALTDIALGSTCVAAIEGCH
jgi:hypothetical protein